MYRNKRSKFRRKSYKKGKSRTKKTYLVSRGGIRL